MPDRETGQRPPRVAFVTYHRYPALADDDRLAVAALAEIGIAAEPAVWDDPAVPWGAFDAIVLRSCWDYHLRPDRFRAWLDVVEAAGVPVWNPLALLRWNMDKRYLRELEARGVAVPPTVWVEHGGGGGGPGLGELLRERGWDEAVVKPAISADGEGTWRVHARDAGRLDERLRAAAAQGPVMVQRFLPELGRQGEWSCVFFAGAFSHAVLKHPAAGEFRVQSRFGGTAAAARPTAALVDGAHHALRQAPAADWLYARVDGVLLDGALTLLELEMLEPSLFFEADRAAPARFAAALARRLGRL